jgi:hypothetical protein
VSGQLHAPATLAPGKSPRYPFNRRLGGPRAGLDDMEKWKFFTLPGLELPPPAGCPARSQALYRLSCLSTETETYSANKNDEWIVIKVAHRQPKNAKWDLCHATGCCIKTLIVSPHLHLGLPFSLFPSGFPTSMLYAFIFIFYPICAICPALPCPSHPLWLDCSNICSILAFKIIHTWELCHYLLPQFQIFPLNNILTFVGS